MITMAADLARDVRFQNAVTLADVDHVPVAVVMHDRDVLSKASRLARLDVHNARERAAQNAQPATP